VAQVDVARARRTGGDRIGAVETPKVVPNAAGYDSPELRGRAIRKAFEGILMLDENPKSVPDEYKHLFSREFRNLFAGKGMESYTKGERVHQLLELLERQKIYDDKWVMENNTAFSGISILRKALDNSGDSVQAIKNVNKVMPKIKEVDSLLYRMILKRNLDPTEARLLTRLKILTERKDVMVVIKEFEKYGGYYANLAAKWYDAKLRNNIQALLNYVGNLKKTAIATELDYLKGTRVKAGSWKGNPEDLNVYIKLIQGIINDLTQYGDKGLAGEINNSNEVKHLIHYDEEVAYFISLLNDVVKGEEQEDWGLFLEKFYKRLKREEEQIKDFGDRVNAGAMEEVKKKYHMYPKMWRSMLGGAINMLNDPRKKREAIIAARNRIISIIAAKIEDISKVLRKELRKPIKSVHAIVIGKLKDISNAKSVYLSIAERRYRIFERGLKVVRGKFVDKNKALTPLINDSADESAAMRRELLEIFMVLSRIKEGKQQQARYDMQNRRAIRESNPTRAVPRLLMTQGVLVNLEVLSEKEKKALEDGLRKLGGMPARFGMISKKNDNLISGLEELFRFMISSGFVINLEGV